jgi:hypothetical protein
MLNNYICSFKKEVLMTKFFPLQIIGSLLALAIFYSIRHVFEQTIHYNDYHMITIAMMILFFTVFMNFSLLNGSKKDVVLFNVIAIGVYSTLLTLPVGYTLLEVKLIFYNWGTIKIIDLKVPIILLFLDIMMSYCGIIWLCMNTEDYVLAKNLPKAWTYIIVFLNFILVFMSMAYIFRQDIF